MHRVEKTVHSKSFAIMAIILLLFSIFSSSFPLGTLSADTTDSNGIQEEGHGQIKNDEGEKDYPEATINKEVSFGNKPGEFFIDLTVKGKDSNAGMTTDIVIPYDLSNSMKEPIQGGSTRAAVAKDALTDFLNGLLDGQSDRYRVAFVPYGSSIMDGNSTTLLQNPANPNGGNYYEDSTNPYNYYVGNFTSNANDITSIVPGTAEHGNHGGTFTQQALVRAGQIMATSNADRKIIVTITDGLPTISERNGVVWGTGSESQNANHMAQHRQNTIAAANALKNDYTLYSVGIGLTQSSTTEREVIEGIADGADKAYYANSVQELVNALNEISSQLKIGSVVNGSITDPITSEFILPENPFGQAGSDQLENGEYFLSASDPGLLEGVTVKAENQHILVDGLNLGENEWVKVRYKVQIDTENPDLDPSKLYKTNGTTTLTPNGDVPDNKHKFPEPEASAEPIKVSGKKAWADWGYDVHRPDKITLQLIREIDGEEKVVESVDVPNNGTDVWEYEFKEAVVYDNKGERINYIIREIMPGDSGEYYEYEFGGISPETTDVRNLFKQDAKIQLVKTAKSASELGVDEIEVGKDINYTFEFTNTGNLPLKDISLEDELDGISAITYETLNGEPLTQDIADVVMEPGDVIVATATYEVTQEDFDYGQVLNHAEVVGTPTVPNPNQFDGQMNEFDDTPVRDDDDAAVPGSLDPAISLTKTANKEKVSEVGEEIEYTFVVENTGNTTLTEVILNDPMLGGEIKLDVDTLEPGESTTVTLEYEVTQEDINNGEIVNNADVEGTPPPAYTENPDNPDKVTDKDDEIVEADQTSEIELVKEADKEELVVDETITYTFTSTNTGNTTLTNVTITDILDGISNIEYLTVNGNTIADPDNITLEPGDVLVATATYKVTQDDVDLGQVFNKATVTGIDPKDEVVTDEDDAAVPSNPTLGIELVKTSDKQYVTEAGQEIEYTFEVTNTSNVTLIDVEVNDPMLKELDIDIVLDQTTLKPGEKATGKATYTVTEEDIENGKIKNIATATGTPPNPNDEPPVSPPAEDEVPVAKIQLEKSVLPGIYTEIGQELTYTLVITNTGEVTLNEITLTDEMLGGEITLDVNSLKPGESTEVAIPYTVTQADVTEGEIVNTATTEGTPEGYDPENPNTPGKVIDEDEVTAKYAGLIIEKTSNKEEVTKAGEEITYTFEVTNTGKVTLENVVVNDEMLADLEIDVELVETTLEPGESTTGTATYTVTQEDIDNGGVYNVATTTGTPPGYDPEDPEFPDKPPVSPPDEEDVPAKQDPNISLEKVANVDEYAQVGDEIVYTFTATNTGNVTLTDVKIDDETFGFEVWLDKTTLAPGESTIGAYTHKVTQANLDNGEIHNFANTEGTPPPVIDPEDPDNPVAQEPVTDEDDEEVSGKQDAALVLEKVADKQEVEQAGDEITYTLTVTNKGNVTLDHVTVNDEMLGGDLAVTPSTLAPGETGTVTGTYTVTQEDIDNKDQIINIATATGTPPGGDPEDPDNPTTPPTEEKVPVVNDPEITLVKLADKERLVNGETITYTFTATNTGNTTLNKVNLVDELEGISEIEYVTVNGEEIVDPENITLIPGDVLVATATYEVTQADVDANEVYNHATVEGTPPAKENPEDPDNPIEQDPVTDDDDAKVPSEHKPELALEKTTEKEVVTEAGETITYKFVVTNTGNVTIDDPKVDDPKLAELGIEIELDKDTLAPGESTIGYADYTVTQEDIDNVDNIVNIATATGTPPGGNPEDPDNPKTPPVEEEVPVERNDDIMLEKISTEKTYGKVGDKITYTFTVTNTGNTTLTDVEVYDETFDVTIDIEKTTLAPGESTIGTWTYEGVTQADLDNGEIHNIAVAEGTPPPTIDPEDPDNPVDTPPVTDEDEEKVPGTVKADLALEKKADKQEVSKAGEEIEYTLTVTNIGNVTLTDVTVNDPMLGGDLAVSPSTLAPGESGEVKGTYTVTQDDIDNANKIVNIATATGTPPDPVDPEEPTEPPVTPPVEEEVPVKKDPAIALEKVAIEETYAEVGDTITYTFTVTNTGNTTLSDVEVYDETFDVTIEIEKTTLAPGESTTGTWTYEGVTQADLDNGEIHNIAVAEGTPPPTIDPEDPDNPVDTPPVTDKDDEKVPGTVNADLALEKKADKQEVSEAGEEIEYTLTVTNTGNVTLTNVTVNDPMLGGDLAVSPSTLAPGESGEVKGTYTVTQADIDNEAEIVNIATATGTPPDPVDPEDPTDPPVTPPVEEEVPVKKDPAISLEKTANVEEDYQFTTLGEEIEYRFTVTNTGNVTLTDVKVDDETFSVEIGLEKTTLAPGESTTGTFTHKVTQENLDSGLVHNFAKTEGTPPPTIDPEDPDNPVEQPPVTDEDDEKVPGKHDPQLSLEKVADKQFVERAGEEIEYTLTVTNTGNVTVRDVTVDDPMLGGKHSVEPSTLAPGESGTYTGTYEVTQADIDNKEEIVNIATATGTPPDPEDPEVPPVDPPVTPPTEEKVPVEDDPAITLVKQADRDSLVEGETITYTFTATNTGSTTLHKVNLVDELDGISEIEYVTVNDEEIADPANITLSPGDVLVATATYVVTQADVDANEVYNVATVEGTPPPKENPEDPDNPIEQDPVTDEDDAKVPAEQKPEISLEKSTKKQEVSKAGEVITYKFVVTNTGNVTLDNVSVNDPMLDELGIDVELEKTDLVPGESTVGYAEYTVTQADIDHSDTIVNIATATGFPPGYDPEDPPTNPEDPGYPPVSPPDEVEVPVTKDSALVIEKTADKKTVVEAGDTITYQFIVTNVGNLTLTNVKVNDSMLENAEIEVELDTTTLKPGEQAVGIATYTVTQADIDSGLIKNIATATGTPPGGDPNDPNNPTSPPDEVDVPTKQNPAIDLQKTSNTKTVTKVGQKVTYQFVVTNTGNVSLTDIEVNDPMLGGTIKVDTLKLAPGEWATVTKDYFVKEADLKANKLVNIATATGTPPNYNPNDPESEKPTDTDQHEIPTGDGPTLPKTATNTFNILMIGLSVVLAGVIGQVATRRRKHS